MDRQWRRNEFESVGAPVRSEAPEIFFNFFWVVPLHILALKAQLVFLVSAFVMVSAVWSLSSNHGTPVFSHLEKWGHAPLPVPHGVGATVNRGDWFFKPARG